MTGKMTGGPMPDLSLAWVGPVVFAGGSVLSVAAARRVHRRPKGASGGWPAPNTRWLVILTAVLPAPVLPASVRQRRKPVRSKSVSS
jgi:hypothetical protein